MTHPYVFTISSSTLNVSISGPDAFLQSASNCTTFDVTSTSSYTNPVSGATPYQGTVAITFSSTHFSISPATTTLTMNLSGSTLTATNKTVCYDGSSSIDEKVSFLFNENGYDNDALPTSGHPYIYVLGGDFHFFVYAPDAFVEGCSDETTFDVWYLGPVSGASANDTITIMVNDAKAPATPASCLVAASSGSTFNAPVTLTYTDIGTAS